MSNGEKRRRTEEALAGGSPRPVPVSVWYHFDKGHVSGRTMAEAHLEHLARYDLDYLKVMNDNPYEMPRGMEVIEKAGEWRKLEPLGAGTKGFVGQLEGLRVLVKEAGGRVMMTTTIFNAFATGQKVCGGRLLEHLREDPEAVDAGLSTITESLCVLARECVGAGADGIYLACSGNAKGELSGAEYREHVLKHDEAILRAAGEGRFNFVHMHGEGVDVGMFAGLPGDVLNWNSRRTRPSLGEARGMTRMCLCGGWDQEGAIAKGPVKEIEAEAQEATAQTKGSHFLMGAGCTIPSETPEEYIRAAVGAARKASGA